MSKIWNTTVQLLQQPRSDNTIFCKVGIQLQYFVELHPSHVSYINNIFRLIAYMFNKPIYSTERHVMFPYLQQSLRSSTLLLYEFAVIRTIMLFISSLTHSFVSAIAFMMLVGLLFIHIIY